MVLTKFNHQKGILDSQFIDDVTLKEIVDYIIATKNNTTYPRNLKILTDATRALMKLVPDDLKVIVSENNKSIEKYNYIIDAIVIDKPKETAISLLYQEMAKNSKYRFQVFSTREAAIEWLTNVII